MEGENIHPSRNLLDFKNETNNKCRSVYHLDASSAEPVGGIARFQTVINHYRNGEMFKGRPELLTFFSGDAFNPSLESSVTKGKEICLPLRRGEGAKMVT